MADNIYPSVKYIPRNRTQPEHDKLDINADRARIVDDSAEFSVMISRQWSSADEQIAYQIAARDAWKDGAL